MTGFDRRYKETWFMTNEDWVAKLLKLCEQKHGPDTSTMRQLRRQLDALRQPKPDEVRQFAPGSALSPTAP
jgi:hypothetical protein